MSHYFFTVLSLVFNSYRYLFKIQLQKNNSYKHKILLNSNKNKFCLDIITNIIMLHYCEIPVLFIKHYYWHLVYFKNKLSN